MAKDKGKGSAWTRHFWRKLRDGKPFLYPSGRVGWVEQEGWPPDDYIAQAVRTTRRSKRIVFQWARVEPLQSEQASSLWWACSVKRCGKIVRHVLVDELGQETFVCETSANWYAVVRGLVQEGHEYGWICRWGGNEPRPW